jgi:hypothetical protein
LWSAPLRVHNVITDWDEKAVAIVTPMPPYDAQRVMGMVHAAMFDAVNSIEQRYRRIWSSFREPEHVEGSRRRGAALWTGVD